MIINTDWSERSVHSSWWKPFFYQLLCLSNENRSKERKPCILNLHTFFWRAILDLSTSWHIFLRISTKKQLDNHVFRWYFSLLATYKQLLGINDIFMGNKSSSKFSFLLPPWILVQKSHEVWISVVNRFLMDSDEYLMVCPLSVKNGQKCHFWGETY